MSTASHAARYVRGAKTFWQGHQHATVLGALSHVTAHIDVPCRAVGLARKALQRNLGAGSAVEVFDAAIAELITAGQTRAPAQQEMWA